MRGKTVVFVLLGGAIIFTAFAYWYFFSQSSPDDRFNLNRQPIPANAGDSVLFAAMPEDYQATISQYIAPDAPNQAMGSATYSNGTNTVNLSVRALRDFELQDFLSGKVEDLSKQCDPSTSSVTFHPGQPTPFRYSKCPLNNPGGLVYQFAWVNGSWYLQASGPDVEALLHFVNLYPY